MSRGPRNCIVDEIAVDLAVDGVSQDLNHCERVLAVGELTRRGQSIREISERLAIHSRLTSLYRKQARQKEAAP